MMCQPQGFVATSPLYLPNYSKKQRSVIKLVLLMWKLIMWLKHQTNDAWSLRFF